MKALAGPKRRWRRLKKVRHSFSFIGCAGDNPAVGDGQHLTTGIDAEWWVLSCGARSCLSCCCLFPAHLREGVGKADSGTGECSASPAPGAVPAPGMSGLWLEPRVSHEAGVGCRKWGRRAVRCGVEAAGACSMGCSFTPLLGASWLWCDLFQAQGECVPVCAALGFRERTVNPSTRQARVGELSRARAAGSVG